MGYLDKLDLETKLESKDEYEELLEEYQFKLLKLQRKIVEEGIAVCIAYEGVDAAGKGGNIKRVTEALDPRGYEVHAIGAPSDGEKAHHWLRRFWLRIPPRGRIGIFDRTWYGRVLVERVEGFATKKEWKRAYDEINGFERMLAEEGVVFVKFWLHISSSEQLERFEKRRDDPLKAWKLTDEDWRNRGKRRAYTAAVEEMLERTDTRRAPWTVVPAESKPYARVFVMEQVIKALRQALRRRPSGGR